MFLWWFSDPDSGDSAHYWCDAAGVPCVHVLWYAVQPGHHEQHRPHPGLPADDIHEEGHTECKSKSQDINCGNLYFKSIDF